MCISLRPSSYVMGSNVNLGPFGVSGVKRSFSLKMLYLVHVTEHDHETYTDWSAWDALPMLWGQMSIWGHLGSLESKGHLHLKCFNSSKLHSMTIRLIHVHQLETFYLCYGGQMSIWGHWGPKVVFHYKCYNLSMLHSLAIRLIRVHQLVILFLFYGVKCQSGVIWGHRGRKVIFAKNALTRPWYIAWPYDSYMSISLRPSIFVSGSNVNLGSAWGHPGRVRRLWRQQILVL